MFVGAVPRPAVEQITRSVPFTEWRQVFVGCSGSFRFDRAVRDVHPTVAVHSNDVSLLSCSLGALATGAEFPIAFKGRLAFIEDLVAGQPFAARVAAVEVALEMAKYKGANPYAQAHFAHYQERFVEFLAPVLEAAGCVPRRAAHRELPPGRFPRAGAARGRGRRRRGGFPANLQERV